ncbi:phosphoribosylaminoimidazole synthetase [Parvularcula bermudensis HTCC2503]|uniref:Phosphoribosylformylglycinamidine cyclo-ligase n=1 Tax=Parvularcula bermudensis (strain ATCC BAA-594 / HTCC2503 / KCTC 12087) TaxID=314260 RepID=E0TC21_PARBH|nr:phosphoribosylformylglycinamidine cyclo-ligase [Parvularcula bermudensis]ADM09814.1 phosphoribosylaminoimidazole synthetase [Parvularcula bermudensis HTCC2503]
MAEDPYAKAGVNIAAGNRLVDRIAPLAKATKQAGSGGDLGGFGGVFDLKATGFQDPVLVSGTDGVGTKLMLAQAMGRHDTIGIDLVAMCANDILTQAAKPLFFLDYFATGQLDEAVAASVVEGIATACRETEMVLIGGETAEMPGLYGPGHYDLAGFCVGAAERTGLLPRPDLMAEGDVLIGLPSSGAHANGYSLIRQIVERSGMAWSDKAPFAETSLGDAFLTPTRLYIRDCLPLAEAGHLKAMAHITGGGLTENVPRVLPSSLRPRYDETALTLPPLFAWLAETGDIEQTAMRRTFNCGIGMVLIASPPAVDGLLSALTEARVIGDLVPS